MAQLSNPVSTSEREEKKLSVLAEHDVISMGEAEYMNDAQLAFFRSRLIALEAVLIARTRASAFEIADVSVEADPVDRASAEGEHQLAIATRVRDGEQLVEIKAALERIEAGEYGWCVETGEMIGVARLLVRPTAVLCVEAQQRRESKSTRYRS